MQHGFGIRLGTPQCMQHSIRCSTVTAIVVHVALTVQIWLESIYIEAYIGYRIYIGYWDDI